MEEKYQIINQDSIGNIDTAIFGSGCFWCTEAIFSELKGVLKAESGYAGGEIVKPSYNEVCSGKTGHAEVCRIIFDTSVVEYKVLLEVFWKTHDPTTLNRQGADVGTQYRSVIFYMNEAQKEEAEFYRTELTKAKIWDKPIVTAIEPYRNYYVAEISHQDYYANNPNAGYCSFVITPKLEKFRKVFADRLK